MNPDQAEELGEHLRQARHRRGMSAVDLAELTDVNDATIVRLENGKIATPAADKLGRIADALGLEVSDVFAMAGYGTTTSLPTLPLYLRKRYDMPAEAMEQIEHFAAKVARRHGISLSGPASWRRRSLNIKNDSTTKKGGHRAQHKQSTKHQHIGHLACVGPETFADRW